MSLALKRKYEQLAESRHVATQYRNMPTYSQLNKAIAAMNHLYRVYQMYGSSGKYWL